MELETGTLVSGHYRIVATVGRGGMGQVYSADNTRTGRRVALKILRADVREKRGVVERFRREALATGRIRSDYVTQVLDVEEDPEHGLVIVFELLEGESLIDRLRRGGPLSLGDVLPLMDQAFQGLIDAHAAGIVHRDLKPSNVFLEKRPSGEVRVKLLDFGIAKLPKELTDGESTLTTDGQNLGTYSYMAPEQIGKAGSVDERADIYAMGTMIFEAIAAERPFDARNFPALLEMKLRGAPRRLTDVMLSVDPRLEAFVAKCLDREPADRFASATEARAAWLSLGDLADPPANALPDPAPAPTAAPSNALRVPEVAGPVSGDATLRMARARASASEGTGGTLRMTARRDAPDDGATPLSADPTRRMPPTRARGGGTVPMVEGQALGGGGAPAAEAPAIRAADSEAAPAADARVGAGTAVSGAALEATLSEEHAVRIDARDVDARIARMQAAAAPRPRAWRAARFGLVAVAFVLLAAIAFYLARAYMAAPGVR